MPRNNRKKWFSFIPLAYFNLFASVAFLGFSIYLEQIRPMPACAFCMTLRLLLIILFSLSLSAILAPTSRRIIYPTQFTLSISGLFLSLRQLYFESVATRLALCPKAGSSALQTILNWLSKGAPACKKTYLIGPISLTMYACLSFSVLSVIAFHLLYKKAKRK